MEREAEMCDVSEEMYECVLCGSAEISCCSNVKKLMTWNEREIDATYTVRVGKTKMHYFLLLL